MLAKGGANAGRDFLNRVAARIASPGRTGVLKTAEPGKGRMARFWDEKDIGVEDVAVGQIDVKRRDEDAARMPCLDMSVQALGEAKHDVLV